MEDQSDNHDLNEVGGELTSTGPQPKPASLLHAQVQFELEVQPCVCFRCGMVLTGRNGLRKHSRNHPAGNEDVCAFCGKCFIQQSQLKKHMLTHTKSHICSQCGKGYCGISALVQHMHKKHRDKFRSCSQCYSEFSKTSDLVTHMTYHLPCVHCGQLLSNLHAMYLHIEVHEKKKLEHIKELKMDENNVQANYGMDVGQDSDNQHQTTAMTSQNQFLCYACGKEFLTCCELESHVSSEATQKPHVCHVCEQRFTLPHSLRVHMTYHPVCPVCQKTFSMGSDLTKHVCTGRQINNTNPESTEIKMEVPHRKEKQSAVKNQLSLMSISPLQSPMLQKSLSKEPTPNAGSVSQEPNTELNLDSHTREEHHMCSHCSDVFTNLVELQNHKITVHSRLFTCLICHEKFSVLDMLKKHLIEHHGKMCDDSSEMEEPKICVSLSHNEASSLTPKRQNKYNSDHSYALACEGERELISTPKSSPSEKRYFCPICFQKFVLLDSLNIHLKYHPSCPVCGRKVYKPSDLQVHVCATGTQTVDSSLSESGQTSLEPPSQPWGAGEHTESQEPYNHSSQHVIPVVEKGKPSQCDKNHTQTSSRMSHPLEGKEQPRVVCPQCGEGFSTESNLTIHLRYHTVCPFCDKTFTHESALKAHIQTHIHLGHDSHQNIEGVQSNISQDSVKNQDGQELETTKRRLKCHKCTCCSKSYVTLFSLQNHVKKEHSGLRPYKCHQCAKGFKTFSKLKLHILTHTGNKCHICPHCDKGFITKTGLKIHVNTHTRKMVYPCPQCDRQFLQRGNLRVHMLTHTKVKPYKCEVCGKGCSTKQALIYHMRTHTKEKPYLCQHCGKAFSQVSSLKAHMYTHTGDHPLKCTYCDKRFVQARILKEHMCTHTGEQPYSCAHCSKRFRNLSSLRLHKMIHTGKQPHVCTKCGKGFRTSTTLRYHMSSHTGVAPHTCLHCGKEFTGAAYLKIHMFAHLGRKPHPCPHCSKGFNQLSLLKRHISKAHKGKSLYSNCKACVSGFTEVPELVKHMSSHKKSCL